MRCFYDADEQIDLWGRFLAEELPVIYGEQAAAVVVFVSAEYVARDWTRLERRAALGKAVQEPQEYVLPARFDDTPLPGLLPDMVVVDLRTRTPQQFAAMIADKLAALGITGPCGTAEGRDPGRVQDLPTAPPAGAVRVREADPRRLGVHAAISVPGDPDEGLPEYVARDVDAAASGVRAKVSAAAKRGGFMLLVGGSSVGKTRCAFEAVRALLPGWWLVHPAGPAEVAALAQVPCPQMVVWLDELQRYLDGERGLTVAVLQALLNAPSPVVIIGTLWPDRYTAYTTMPVPGGADPHARERQVLDLANIVRIAPTFSPVEQERARAAASRDLRLRTALASAGYGLTQTLAAAPQLVARWEGAQDAAPYGWAVLTAALDVARLGARAPLSTDLLRAAAPGYCTSQQQAEAPGNWFELSVAYATGKLYGAAAALSTEGAGMGQIAGYTPADYLVQHASRRRRYVRVPASTWEALISHHRDPADIARLANSAESRLLYCYAMPLYRCAADGGDEDAAFALADLLAKRGDVDELRDRADAGDKNSAWHLAVLLAERGDLDELRDRADAGDRDAAMRLADLLADRGDSDSAMQVLRPGVDAGDPAAALALVRVLVDRGDLDELRDRADAGDRDAAMRLADLLADRGNLDEAAQVPRPRAAAGDRDAVRILAGLLADLGDVDELRDWASAGDRFAALRLADVLADHGDVDGAARVLRSSADAGDRDAARDLARLLADQGDLDKLRYRADSGDRDAAVRLARVLADQGNVDELRDRASAGDRDAALRMADLLAGCGNLDEAARVLRPRADIGDPAAAMRLADLLADRGDVDELRNRAEAGDGYAAGQLAKILADRGDLVRQPHLAS